MQVINTLTNHVEATLAGGQAAQALVYVPEAVPTGDGLANLVPLGSSGQSVLRPPGTSSPSALSTVTLNNPGPIDLLEAAVTGLKANSSYTLGLVRGPGEARSGVSAFEHVSDERGRSPDCRVARSATARCGRLARAERAALSGDCPGEWDTARAGPVAIEQHATAVAGLG